MGAELARVRKVLARLLDTGVTTDPLDRIHKIFPVAISRREGEALRGWVKREGAVSTVEIGLGYGISALFICEGLLPNGHASARHVALDPNQARGFSDWGLQVLDEAGLGPMLEFRAEASEIALPRFVDF